MSQFAMLNELKGEWRADGFDESRVELWAIGSSASEEAVPGFAGVSDSACFIDTEGDEGPIRTYGSLKDDVVVVDTEGLIALRTNLGEHSLEEPSQRALVDDAVRGLLVPSAAQ